MLAGAGRGDRVGRSAGAPEQKIHIDAKLDSQAEGKRLLRPRAAATSDPAVGPPGAAMLAPGFDPLSLLASAALPEARGASSPHLWVTELVRRIAWGGDRRRATARLELAGGRFAGAALQIEARDGVLSVMLEVPPGADGGELASLLGERLLARGLSIESVCVA